jgi:hypothetical protein
MNIKEKNVIMTRFRILLAAVNSKTVMPDQEKEIIVNLVTNMVKDYPFIAEEYSSEYKIVNGQIAEDGHLMSIVHKYWNAAFSGVINVPVRTYKSPEALIEWVLTDRNWTPEDRWTMLTTCANFMLYNRNYEVSDDSPAQTKALGSIREIYEMLLQTKGAENAMTINGLWKHVNMYLQFAFDHKVYNGIDQEVVNAIILIEKIHPLMSKAYWDNQALISSEEEIKEVIENDTLEE